NDNTIQLSIKPGERVGAACTLNLTPATDYLVLSNRTATAEKGTRRAIQFYRPLNENVVYVTGHVPLADTGYTDDLTVHNPAGLFMTLFRQALTRNGVSVRGTIRTLNWPDTSPRTISNQIELASVESLSMRDLAREVMKPSQNLYTDLLLGYMGER